MKPPNPTNTETEFGEADILKPCISILSLAVLQGWYFSVPLIIYYPESMLDVDVNDCYFV